MPSENVASARAVYELFSTGDFSRLGEIVAPDVKDHSEFPGIISDGAQRLKDVITLFRSAFSDLKMDVQDVIAEGEKVVVRVAMSGRHTGDFAGIPATGKSFSIEGIDIIRFSGGKAVEHWGIQDQVGMMMQLGVMPGQ